LLASLVACRLRPPTRRMTVVCSRRRRSLYIGPPRVWLDRTPVAKAGQCGTAQRATSFGTTTSCYSNGSDKPHRRRRADKSAVFAGWRQCTPLSSTSLSTHTRVRLRNNISIGFSVFAGLTLVPNAQTGNRQTHATPSVAIARICAMHGMRANDTKGRSHP